MTDEQKDDLQVTAADLQVLSDLEALEGLMETAEGLNQLEAAEELGTLSKAALAAGASDLTRAEDAFKVAERVSLLGKIVGDAGVTDMTEGAELLLASEDIRVQSAILGSVADEDLTQGMDIAAIAGQLWAASEVVDALDMPVLAAFLEAKGQDLHDIAVDTIFRFGATRALSEVMAGTGRSVGDLGAGEMAEGMVRVVTSAGLTDRSDQLMEAGIDLAGRGLDEMAAAAELGAAAEDLTASGVAEIAEGMANVGSAERMADIAELLEEAENQD